MDQNRTDPQDIVPSQPVPGALPQPVTRRPVMSDFAPRPSAGMSIPVRGAQPAPAPTPQPHTSPTVTSSVFAPPPVPGPNPTQPSPNPTPSPVTPAPEEVQAPPASDVTPTESKPTKPPKERSRNGHAGLVGLVVFVLLSALLLSPLLPGKIIENAPGSSQSFSTGDQNIACAGTLSPVKTTLTYDSKSGSPLVYKYSTTSTIQATCDGKAGTATGGHSSQFNPMGALADVMLAFVVAFVTAKIWRKLRGAKD